MPERARLVDMISFVNTCIRDQKLLIVKNLLSLCKRDFEVMYRLDKEFINEACSVCHDLLSELKRSRFEHIHACRRKEEAKRADEQFSNEMQYCFLCFQWFADTVL